MNFVDYIFDISKNSNKDLIVGNSETVSYQKLYQQVNQLSCWLQREFGENEKIILVSENSAFFIAAYLGVIKSGNICVPVNPSITVDALNYIIEQCKSKIGFVQKKSLARFEMLIPQMYDESVLDALSMEHTPKREATSALFLAQDFEQARIAEILFTSGSTALPKGVMLSHRNLIANTNSIIKYLKLTEDARVEVVLPFYYCYGLSLLHTHIRVGGSLVINNTFIMLNTVIDDLQKYQCTGFAGVPSHFQILLRKSRRFKNTDFPDLKYVTQAGGKLPNVFIKEFVESFPNIHFYVMYGQTEATARLSYLPPELVLKKMGSIGKGIPDVKLEVVNKAGKPVMPGEVGEIVASGENIMDGYFQNPDLTSKTIKNGQLYTGDIGTIDTEGYIYILAREKEFLKVGGERVSPKEVEEVIVKLPEIVDCSIVGVQDDILGEAIKAFIVLNKGARLTEEAIRKYCNKHLSSNKIPKYIRFIDKIPVSATGKKVKDQLIRLN